MTLPPDENRLVARLRNEVAEAERRAEQVEARSARVRAELAQLERDGGGSARDLFRRRAAVDEVERERRTVRAEVATLRERLEQLLERDRGRDRDRPIGNWRADVPVLLLPVRIETRYGTAADDLRVRIFPDQPHIDGHETELTIAERDAGHAYWTTRWAASTPEAEAELGAAAFAALSRRFRPRRAAWIAAATRPTNADAVPRAPAPVFADVAERDAAWARASFAALLPDQWVVVGYVRGADRKLHPWFSKRTTRVAERLNTSIDPRATKEVPVDAEGIATELPFDDDLRWLIDYEVAAKAGMAVTIAATDCDQTIWAGALRDKKIERLVVYGVAGGSDPAAGAAAMEQALRAHVYSDGLAILAPGTPTNNGDAQDAGYDAADETLTIAMDPMRPTPAERPALDLLVAALGIDPVAAHIDRIDQAGLTDQAVVGDIVNATWMATLGQTLDQMLDPDLSDAEIAAARAFCVAWLKPGGPLPALRIGRQPYGVLPVVSSTLYQPADSADRRLDQVLDAVRDTWTFAARKTPHMARSRGSVTDTMQALLQTGPMARGNSYRRVLGPLIAANSGVDPSLANGQQALRKAIFSAVGISQKARLGTLTLEGKTRRLGAPFVQARIATPDEKLSPNYLQDIATEARRPDARALLGKRSAGGTLLEALCAHATVYELDHTIAFVVHQSQVTGGRAAAVPPKVSMRIAEMTAVEDVATPPSVPGRRAAVTVTNPAELASVVLDVTAGRTVADFVLTHLDDQLSLPWRFGGSFRSVCDSMTRLAGRPAAQLDRLFRGVLDAYSYRLDPWITALATKRLAWWRERSGGKGLQIGGFGWVEDLKRDTRPQSEGYVHAPSIHHAQTAAVLRSGHLAHRDAAGQALAIDLSSRRVRLALKLLEGVAQGQPIAALLGYRFERSLRDRGIGLARHILPLRRRFPMKPPQDEAVLSQQEAIAARDVVDGVKLIDARRKGGAWLAGTAPMPAGTDLAAIEACVAEIDDIFDATSDLLVAEGVHQLVGGNLERASAALAGMDRQTRPLDPEVIRTPRSGRAFAQRAGVLLSNEEAPAGWPAADVRARAEPYLNRWVGQAIGDPAGWRFAARVTMPDGVVRPLEPVGLDELGLSPMSLLMLSNIGGKGEASEVRERLAMRFAGQVSSGERAADAMLSLLGEAPAGGGRGLSAFEALMARIRDVASKHRAAEPTDLAGLGVEVETVGDWRIVAKRVDRVRDALVKARDGLAHAIAHPRPDRLADALDEASRAGASGASVCSDDEEALLAQAQDVAVRVERLLARAAAETPGDAALAPRDALAAQVRRLRALLGESFPVLPPFTLPDGRAGELMVSLADRAALIGDDAAVLHGWMARMAEVRPALAELAGCLVAAELSGAPPASLAVAQFPHAQGARWIGLPLAEKTPVDVDVSLVVHAPDLSPGDATPALFAGLVSDTWTETIPGATETTAIAFHYDAPGARPPQAMLLAVHPDPAATQWRPSEILATVNEAAELTAIRAVRPQELQIAGAVLPLIYLPDNYSPDAPGVDFRAIRDLVMAQTPPYLRNVLGKE